ncbi:MAG: hypothetical protein ACRDO4_12085 [Nocardioides sp.]
MTTGLKRTWVLAVVAALLGVLSLGTPAYADQKKLKLAGSAAGPFGDHLTTPLFEGTYVPGSATSSFYVKNDSSQTARATIALVEKAPVNDFERALSFSASVDGTTGTPVPLFEDQKKNQCRTIVTGPTMDGGAVQRIDVNMHVAGSAPMDENASFSFVVTLSQVTKKGKVDVCGPQSPGGPAARVEVLGASATASPTAAATEVEPASAGRSLPNVVAGGFVLVAAGALLFAALRRRDDEPTNP